MTEQKKTVQVITDPATQVNGPSVGLLVTGVIGAVISIFMLFALGIGLSFGSLWEWRHADWSKDFYEGIFGLGGSFFGLIVAAFVIYAALKMKELKQWSLSIVASILVMIPCVSPCCIIGLPIGIWALVVLNRPEVKEAFR